MTSEAPYRPGQEPGEVSPGAGGPAPYGDHPAQQDNGYPGAPDLGWAPPPPVGRPAQPAPAWAASDDQAPSWTPPGGHPANRGSAQVPPPAWGTPAEHGSPAWAAAVVPSAPHGEQPAWTQPGEPNARGTAQVPVPATPQPNEAWPASFGQQQVGPPEDRSGGWPVGAAAQQRDDPNRSGGWQSGAPAAAQDDPTRSGGWQAVSHDEGLDHSGGWAAGRAAGQTDTPQQPAWGTPGPGNRPEVEAWTPSDGPARASASVPTPDWAGTEDNPASWTPQRPAIADAEPWAPGEAWGRAAEAEDAPAYQPSPGPGISPANAVPLPPQEQRVPGAALAASPPADYLPPTQFGPAAGGWGAPEPSHEQQQSPAGPAVPAPRTSAEGGVSASASVPMASRLTPPADESLRPTGTPTPQPRVYGRPVQPEPEEAPGPSAPNGYPGQQDPRFDEPDAESHDPHVFGGAAPVPSPVGPPPFPPGVPSFVDPTVNNRPVNGVHPQSDERPGSPYGSPGRYDPYGAPGQHDPYGAPGGQQGTYGGPGGQHDPFGGPGSEPGPGGSPSAFSPPPQQAPPAWQQPGPESGATPGHPGLGDADQGRFDAFKPESEPKTEAPTPKVRNGRVLAAVLIAAVLILAVPLGLLMLLGKIGGDNKPAGFNPAVGSCVKQSGTGATAATCGEQGTFTVVSKVDSKDKCADPAQPYVVLPGDGADRVLCLKPAGS